MRPVSKVPRDQNPDGLCKYHLNLSSGVKKPEKEENFNETCPICLDDDGDGKLYPLPCSHRGHLDCFSGMTKLECPLCKAHINNFPKSVKDQIIANGAKYEEEQAVEYEAYIREMNEREREQLQTLENMPVRLPPQMELILALKYVFQLGIPVSLIPIETILELDPSSPLPDPGSIFQNAVRHILSTIQQRTGVSPEEDDGEDAEGGLDDPEELILDEDDVSPFQLEGENLQIVHRVRTVPSREFIRNNPRATAETVLRSVASLFATMSFQIANLPGITQEDLLNLGMGRRTGRDFGTFTPGTGATEEDE